jgi:hypothetical protein
MGRINGPGPRGSDYVLGMVRVAPHCSQQPARHSGGGQGSTYTRAGGGGRGAGGTPRGPPAPRRCGVARCRARSARSVQRNSAKLRARSDRQLQRFVGRQTEGPRAAPCLVACSRPAQTRAGRAEPSWRYMAPGAEHRGRDQSARYLACSQVLPEAAPADRCGLCGL